MQDAQSLVPQSSSDSITVTPISAFDDNYIWVISQASHSFVYVVDPGDAEVVISHLEEHKQVLAGVLITHHHEDHTGGLERLIEYTDHEFDIFGPKNENIAHVTTPISTQTEVTLSKLTSKAKIISVPGHTLGHIAYLIESHLFCGDTLFSGGCGRIFEGTAEQMHHSLQAFAKLPLNTQVYCAHEYTLSNLKFALAVDTENEALAAHNTDCIAQRELGKPTLPSSIGQELSINPFLRCHTQAIQRSVSNHFEVNHSDNVTVFGLLRQWKDNF
ncbi:Hydroxyacylglutathione hydrolase [Shewanella sediminis HAW-EB3]|uniref:Hydroxyacylglutathione hydrolase n=1 Tax=Shewanella sediminis (strain HAW-EB3) TaxID=425104 RepID=A8FUS5_SHESH|nr:hydroxyacylglutathione hydrolase [Shewanella sediminis]ABV36598.1 Hydroxyacylglutathione hydrolase [Shewanella sediminis HAW-EB3]